MIKKTHNPSRTRRPLAMLLACLLLLIPLVFTAPVSANTKSMRVITFNINADRANGSVAGISSYMLGSGADVIGLQEASWAETSITGPNAQKAGGEIAEATKGVYSCYTGIPDLPFKEYGWGWRNPIFWKTSEYNWITGGSYMISEVKTNKFLWDENRIRQATSADYNSIVPNPIAAPEGRAARIVTWVVLEEKSTGKRFIVANGHMPNPLTGLAYRGTQIYYDRMAELQREYNLPMICMGDYNTTNLSPFTNNGYTTAAADGVDRILVKGVTAQSSVVDSGVKAAFNSDHSAVHAVVSVP